MILTLPMRYHFHFPSSSSSSSSSSSFWWCISRSNRFCVASKTALRRAWHVVFAFLLIFLVLVVLRFVAKDGVQRSVLAPPRSKAETASEETASFAPRQPTTNDPKDEKHPRGLWRQAHGEVWMEVRLCHVRHDHEISRIVEVPQMQQKASCETSPVRLRRRTRGARTCFPRSSPLLDNARNAV